MRVMPVDQLALVAHRIMASYVTSRICGASILDPLTDRNSTKMDPKTGARY